MNLLSFPVKTVYGTPVRRVEKQGLFEVLKPLYEVRCTCSACGLQQTLSAFVEIPQERATEEFLANGWDLINKLCSKCKSGE